MFIVETRRSFLMLLRHLTLSYLQEHQVRLSKKISRACPMRVSFNYIDYVNSKMILGGGGWGWGVVLRGMIEGSLSKVSCNDDVQIIKMALQNYLMIID